MQVLHVNWLESFGGASKAAQRLHQGMLRIGVESRMFVLKKTSASESVYEVPGLLGEWMRRLSHRIDPLPLRRYPDRPPNLVFSNNWMPYPVARILNRLPSDLLHFHWIGGGLIPISEMQHVNKVVVWTLHDSWAFTGGCHLPFDCMRYKDTCGECPRLHSTKNNDISHWGLEKKQQSYAKMRITIVTPSRWLAECARSSTLLHDKRIEVIPYGLDLALYKPSDKYAARTALNLPQDKKLILFGAVQSTSDYNKGFHLLRPALHQLATEGWFNRAEAVIFGNAPNAPVEDLGLTPHYLGSINDEMKLCQLYSAADVLIIPSLQENLPNVVLEAMACGTPCVGFRIGGIPDLIEHQINGYMAEPYEPADLANGIVWVLEDDERHRELSAQSAAKIRREHALPDIARRYVALYEAILAERD
ncbi:MAG: glycosyltransferase family 4 protein [Anaerolineae bacterium]|nr:glycosyltransferase family 4 protein [Anaerolineae bacterium]